MEKISNRELDMLIDLHQEKYCEKPMDFLVYKTASELKVYRELEERGLLIKPPCKIGDTLYRVKRGLDIVTTLIVRQITFSDGYMGIKCYDENMKEFMYFTPLDLGKSVFLIRVEAEKELKRMSKEEKEKESE